MSAKRHSSRASFSELSGTASPRRTAANASGNNVPASNQQAVSQLAKLLSGAGSVTSQRMHTRTGSIPVKPPVLSDEEIRIPIDEWQHVVRARLWVHDMATVSTDNSNSSSTNNATPASSVTSGTYHHELLLNLDQVHELIQLNLCVGDLVALYHDPPADDPDFTQVESISKLLILQVTTLDKQLIRQAQLQVSISKTVAELFGLQARKDIFVRKMDPKRVAADYIELTFRDQYISRSGMWRLKTALCGSCIYVNKKVDYAGSIRAQVKAIHTGSEGERPLSCAYVTDLTKVIFRSESAKYFIFIQMSEEMFERDPFGEGAAGSWTFYDKVVYGFLPDLFQHWKKSAVNHIVSIVLTTRVHYDSDEKEDENWTPLSQDYQGNLYRDFYHVVVDWETRHDWQTVLPLLRAQFAIFERRVLERCDHNGITTVAGRLARAQTGNVLEATNMALNIFDRHYIDRDLTRTGLSIVLITAGNGIFEADSALLRLTKRRMMDNGIGMDLVCLTRAPLHCVPLFITHGKSVVQDGSEKSPSSRSGAATPEIEFPRHIVPHWINISFYDVESNSNNRVALKRNYVSREFRLPRKIEALSMNADGTVDYDSFDGIISSSTAASPHPLVQFQSTTVNAPVASNNASNIASFNNQTESNGSFQWSSAPLGSSLPRQMHRLPVPSTDVIIGSVASSIYRRPGDMTVSPLTSSPRRNFTNMTAPQSPAKHFPFYLNPKSKPLRFSSDRRRWCHVLARAFDPFLPSTHWVSLITPACLPLTTDYFPTPEALKHEYQEFTYTLTQNEESMFLLESGNNTTDSLPAQRSESLLKELMSQRLAQGFQWIVSVPGAGVSMPGKRRVVFDDQLTTPNLATLTTAQCPFYLSMGHHFHLLQQTSDHHVEVRRYVRRHEKHVTSHNYPCAIWHLGHDQFITRELSFTPTTALHAYKWNYLDHLIGGYQDVTLTESLRFWRTRFLLIPMETLPKGWQQQEDVPMDEEEWRIAGFLRFIEVFQKARLNGTINSPVQTSTVQGGNNKQAPHASSQLQIQLTTLTASAYVSSEATIQKKLGTAPPSSQDPVTLLMKNMPLDQITSAIQHPMSGIISVDRTWHGRLFRRVWIGSEAVDWIVSHFADIQTREEALSFGNTLMERGLFVHVTHQHRFLDGYYFYQWTNNSGDAAEAGEGSANPVKEANSTATVVMSRRIMIDVDPLKKSDRREWALLHYDASHHPQVCYHFHLHWLVCMARLMDDLIQSWTRKAQQCGLVLVEAPVELPSVNNAPPFQAPLPIKFSVPPPSNEALARLLPQGMSLPGTYFAEALLQSFGFILDLEADDRFPKDVQVIYSFPRGPRPYTQYVHGSGVALVQISPELGGVLWSGNRLLSRQRSSHAESVRLAFISLCRDRERLQRFWKETWRALCRQIGLVDDLEASLFSAGSHSLGQMTVMTAAAPSAALPLQWPLASPIASSALTFATTQTRPRAVSDLQRKESFQPWVAGGHLSALMTRTKSSDQTPDPVLSRAAAMEPHSVHESKSDLPSNDEMHESFVSVAETPQSLENMSKQRTTHGFSVANDATPMVNAIPMTPNTTSTLSLALQRAQSDHLSDRQMLQSDSDTVNYYLQLRGVAAHRENENPL